MPLILPSNSISAGGFAVDNSVRQDDGSSDYFNRTPSSATNQKTFTISLWCKRGELGSANGLILQGVNTGNDDFAIYFVSDDTLQTFSWSGASKQFQVDTQRKFRDPSAWYHIVVAVDTTQATDSDRVKIYVNGVQETALQNVTYPAQNIDLEYNDTSALWVGRSYGGHYFDGYIAEVVSVDGQALDPTSFGEFDEDTGIWKPIDVSGLTFGTNGFYLDFESSDSLGSDVSGNGNNFTVNNLTSIDQSTDTCTNNYSTMNGLYIGGGVTMSEGNLSVAMDASAQFGAFSTIGVSTGKWYMEMKYTAQVGADRMMVGISGNPAKLREGSPIGGTSGYVGSNSEPTSYGYYSDGGNSYNNDVSSSYGDSWTVNDIIGIALDLDNNKLYFSKNGTFQNSGDPTSGATGTGAISITAPSSLTTGNYFFAVSDTSGVYGGTIANNFGSPSFTISSGNSDANGYGNFEYAVPSGYYALNTKNLSEFG